MIWGLVGGPKRKSLLHFYFVLFYYHLLEARDTEWEGIQMGGQVGGTWKNGGSENGNQGLLCRKRLETTGKKEFNLIF